MIQAAMTNIIGEIRPTGFVGPYTAVTKNLNPADIVEVIAYSVPTGGVTGAVTQITMAQNGNSLVPQAYLSSTATATLVTAWSDALNEALA